MRTFFSVLIVAILGFAAPAMAADPDFSPSADPSRIVLNPAGDASTGQIVTWRTDALTTSGLAQYKLATGGVTETAVATSKGPVTFSGWEYTSRHHSARLSGLTPNTKYEYRVGSEGNWSDWYTFETAATDKSPWEMIYFGDAQTGLATHWGPVIEKAFERSPNAKLALHAGDMINDPDEDDQWGYWFNGLGVHGRTVNQFAVLGNHERIRDINLSQFSGHFSNSGNGPETLKSSVHYSDFQDVRFIALNGNFLGTEDQVAFLEEALKNNPNKWSIVSFHEPLFAGAKGRDHSWLRDSLLPLIRQYNVDLVLQGHDHVYARGMLNEDIDAKTGFANGPVFAVANAGPKYYELDPGHDNNWTQNGATRVIAHDQTSTYQPITFDGNVLTYRSYIASKGAEATTDKPVGDLLDAFTITKRKNGSKVVSEGETPPELPDEENPGVKPNLKVGKIAVNKKNGTAKVSVTANTAGRLKVTGNGLRPVTKKVKAKKSITVRIKTKPAKTKVLRRKGKLVVKVKFNLRSNDGKVKNVNRKIKLLAKKR